MQELRPFSLLSAAKQTAYYLEVRFEAALWDICLGAAAGPRPEEGHPEEGWMFLAYFCEKGAILGDHYCAEVGIQKERLLRKVFRMMRCTGAIRFHPEIVAGAKAWGSCRAGRCCLAT